MKEKKEQIAIITITDYTNYGNRLQNYALQEAIYKIKDCDVFTIWNQITNNRMEILKDKFKTIIKFITCYKLRNTKRTNSFKRFTKKYINITKEVYTFMDLEKLNDKFDKFIIGSDQIWNYNFRGDNFGEFEFCLFSNKDKIYSYAASFGVSKINVLYDIYYKGLKNINKISVRENSGVGIINNIYKKEVTVVLDPVFLLTYDEWKKIIKVPKNKILPKNYVFIYFLGEIEDEILKNINEFAKNHNCDVINIMDYNDAFFTSDPAEFLWLIENALIIFTDSFHALSFSIIFNKPFLIFERQDKNLSMNSRIYTILEKLNLLDKFYKGSITEAILQKDYSMTYNILDEEIKKSYDYLSSCLRN